MAADNWPYGGINFKWGKNSRVSRLQLVEKQIWKTAAYQGELRIG